MRFYTVRYKVFQNLKTRESLVSASKFNVLLSFEDRFLQIFEQMLVVGLHYVIYHLKAVFLPDTYVVQLTLNCVSCWMIESSKISTAACKVHS